MIQNALFKLFKGKHCGEKNFFQEAKLASEDDEKADLKKEAQVFRVIFGDLERVAN